MDFKKLGPSIGRVAVGDGIAVYISKRYGGDAHIKAMLKARSRVHERGSVGVPVWSEERVSGRIEWPFRVDATLMRECDVDLRSIFPAMEAPSQKEKSSPGGLGLFLQGATLRSITSNDWGLIESQAAGQPLRTAPPDDRVAHASYVREPPATIVGAQRPPPGPGKRRVFGAPIDFRGLRHEPIDEQGVVFLFGMVARELGFLVESVRTAFPDCRAKQRDRRGHYVEVNIELEFKSSNFREHGHDPAECDLVVCWEHDWPECPVDVLELKSKMRQLDASA